MSNTKQNWTPGVYAGFYWTGIVMTLACLGLTLAGNTQLLYRFEHNRLPLSWVFGAIAVFAFLATELSRPAESVASEAEEESLDLTPEWEAVEV